MVEKRVLERERDRRGARVRGEVGAALVQRIVGEFPFGISRKRLLETFTHKQVRNAAAKRLGKLIEFDAVRESLTINGSHELVDLQGRGLIGVQLDSHDIRRTTWKRIKRLAATINVSITDDAGYMRPVGALFEELESKFGDFKKGLPDRIRELRAVAEKAKDKEERARKMVEVEARVEELRRLRLPVQITQESIVRSIIEHTTMWLDDLAKRARSKWRGGVPPVVLLDVKIVHGAVFDLLLSVLYRRDSDLMAYVREVVQMTPFVKQTQTMSVAASIGLVPTSQRQRKYAEMGATPLTKDFLRIDDVD